MAIQDELSDAAKAEILNTIQQALVVCDISRGGVSTELYRSEYATLTHGIVRLTDTAIIEILDILRMNFYN